MHANNFESTSHQQNPELEVVKELTKLIVGLNLVLWFKKHSIEGTPYNIISKLTFLFAQKRFFLHASDDCEFYLLSSEHNLLDSDKHT